MCCGMPPKPERAYLTRRRKTSLSISFHSSPNPFLSIPYLRGKYILLFIGCNKPGQQKSQSLRSKKFEVAIPHVGIYIYMCVCVCMHTVAVLACMVSPLHLLPPDQLKRRKWPESSLSSAPTGNACSTHNGTRRKATENLPRWQLIDLDDLIWSSDAPFLLPPWTAAHI